MVKKWLIRIAVAIVSVAGLLVLAVVVFLNGLSHHEEKLGGHWIVSRTQSLAIEAGPKPPDRLERTHGWKRVIVAPSAFPYFYIGNDCVLFGTSEGEEEYVKAACGDRPPVVVNHAKIPVNQISSFNWHELRSSPGSFKEVCNNPPHNNPHEAFLPDMALVKGKKQIPWPEICQHAERGESLPDQLGGDWIISETQSPVSEAGVKSYQLERADGWYLWQRVIVAPRVFPYFYIGADCVLFGTSEPEGEYVKAACGDRPPVVVAHGKTPVDGRDLQSDPALVNGKQIPWVEIREHAERGESFPDQE